MRVSRIVFKLHYDIFFNLPSETEMHPIVSGLHSFVRLYYTCMYFVSGEQILSLKTPAQARDGCDALAKALYSRMFYWIVRQVNKLIAPDDEHG